MNRITYQIDLLIRSLSSIFCFLSLLLVLALSSCTTQYQLAKKYFDKGQNYYEKKRYTKCLREFSKTLEKTGTDPARDEISFLLATLYHQLYLIDVSTVWKDLDKSAKAKCPALGKILTESPQGIDFLDKAFQQIRALEKRAQSDELKKLESWLLIEREIIMGDIFARTAKEGGLLLSSETSKIIPEQFVNNLRRYALYELAKHFYLTAWLKNNPADHLILRGLAQHRLKDVYWSLSTVSNALGYAGRSKEFSEFFKTKAQDYWVILKKINQSPYPVISNEIRPNPVRDQPRRASDGANDKELLNQIGAMIDKNLLILDPFFHIQEARTKMSLAIEEILVHKSTNAQVYLLKVIKHLYLAKKLLPSQNTEHQLINSLLEDTYLHLHRLTE